MKKNFITLKDHAIIDPTATAAALRAEWDSIQDKGEDLTGLLERCARLVARRLGIDPEELLKEFGDYVSDVWIDLYDRFSNLGALADKLSERVARGNGSVSLTTIICQSANAVLTRDFRERKKRVRFDSIDEMFDSGFDSSAFAVDVFDDSFFTSLSVSVILDGCSDLQRKVVEMTRDGYTAREIAEETGLSEDAVYRIKKKIRNFARDLLW